MAVTDTKRMTTYAQFGVLAALNLWVDLGLPQEEVARTAASFSEGDPRGTLTECECQQAVDEMVNKGWIVFGKASDDSERTFAYSSPSGTAVFQENKDYWAKQIRK